MSLIPFHHLLTFLTNREGRKLRAAGDKGLQLDFNIAVVSYIFIVTLFMANDNLQQIIKFLYKIKLKNTE